jgi:hypothetical protein
LVACADSIRLGKMQDVRETSKGPAFPEPP